MHYFLKFIFGMKLYRFPTVPLSIIRSFFFFAVHTAMVYVIQLASRIRKDLQFLPDPARKLSANLYDIHLRCVYSKKNFWWWTEELSDTCRVIFQKQIWESSTSGWFYYKNLSRCTVTWTSKLKWSVGLVMFCVRKLPEDGTTLRKKCRSNTSHELCFMTCIL